MRCAVRRSSREFHQLFISRQRAILHSQELNSPLLLKFCHLVFTAEIEMRRKTKAALQGRFGRGSNRKRVASGRAAQRRSRLSFESLESRNLLAVTTFQFGVGGYEGQQDTVIFSLDRDTNFGTEGHISADQQDFNNVRQGLLKFDDIFGNQPGSDSVRRHDQFGRVGGVCSRRLRMPRCR